MKLAALLLGAAALVGTGYIVGKKVADKKWTDELLDDLDDLEDFDDFDEIDNTGNNVSDIDAIHHEENLFENESTVYARENRKKYGEKIKKASLFAVGAIKTGADKLGETIEDIKSSDMVKKGEHTVDAVKEAGDNIKNDIKRDIEDLRNTVSVPNSEFKKETKSVEFTTSRLTPEEQQDTFSETNASDII